MTQVPGGYWARFFATLLDGLILSIPSALAGGMLGGLVTLLLPGTLGTLVSLLAQLLLSSAATYYYYKHFYTTTGSTPGKAVFKLKVVHFEDGSLLDTRHVVIRELVGKPISGLILMIGYLLPLFRADKRALHDLMADSVVVHMAEGSQVPPSQRGVAQAEQ